MPMSYLFNLLKTQFEFYFAFFYVNYLSYHSVLASLIYDYALLSIGNGVFLKKKEFIYMLWNKN